MNTSVLGDPMLMLAALLSLGIMALLAGETIHDFIERRKFRRQRLRSRGPL